MTLSRKNFDRNSYTVYLIKCSRTVKFGNQFGSIFGPVDLGEAVSSLYPNHNLDEWLNRLKEQNKISAESVTADPIGDVDDNAIKIGFIVKVDPISNYFMNDFMVLTWGQP